MTKADANPMSLVDLMNQAPRCTATSKRTGERCKGPAVKGWRVCRFHGAGGGHAPGKDHPSWRHGMRSREWIEQRQEINELVREAREIERMLTSLIEDNPTSRSADKPIKIRQIRG